MRVFALLLAAVIYLAQPPVAFADEAKFVAVKTKRGVSQPFLLTVPDNPKAGVILFVGGDGLLKLSTRGEIRSNKDNFLSRTHKKFSEQGLMVALVDVPSDLEKLNGLFRISTNHANDIFSIINYLKSKADVPIWLVGTSMGSFSAASVGVKKQNSVSGLVLTSSVTRPEHEKELAKLTAKYPAGAAGLNLKGFKKPALIVGHAEDTCKVSPPADAAKLKNKLSNSVRGKVVMLKGGKAPKSDVCAGLSAHGFYGIETEAVAQIVEFITQ